MAGAPAQLEFPGLLPSVLVPNEDGTTRRSTRDWIVDTTCFLLALVLGIALLAEEDHRAGLSEEQWALDALVGFACCCALWLRRRYPVGVLAALTLPAAVLTSPAGAALIAFFTVAVHRPFRYVAIFSGISLAAFFLYTELHPDDETPLLISFEVRMFLFAPATGLVVRDFQANKITVTRRDTGEKQELGLDGADGAIEGLLDAAQQALFDDAAAFREANSHRASSFDELRALITDAGGFVTGAWCGDPECEAKVKAETKATIRYVPLEAKDPGAPCVVCGRPGVDEATWAIAY